VPVEAGTTPALAPAAAPAAPEKRNANGELQAL